ncbi:hypothetical protein [Sulfurisphaera ohwakuensis]|uniref:Membrane-associated HD superfamily phosphohydrolase n=1 Tax=Sulfurisphaera ohwakuensis TaxID=69656 RepID=A0A650CJK1_SULOH|nr:hypothetical protein [Sulfurisphaera ohwakuensis]MBB5253883.1 membrane-associated HD superfamily phosphohydrolase [Sulfurisphaera ohwakuensis]QGR17949.1 hypothetical protein D1869_12735 [Sulfurisphaera ohwakuensis]
MKLFIPMIGSAIALSLGGILLINKVPFIISLGTLIAVLLFLTSSLLIYKEHKSGYYLGLVLSILSILASATSTTHDRALLAFGSSLYISILDILMLLGFYFFPVLYIILFAKKLKRSMTNK